MNPREALNILLQAAGEPVGLLLATNDTEAARQSLYRARAKAKDSRLEKLQIHVSPFPEGQVIVFKSSQASEDEGL